MTYQDHLEDYFETLVVLMESLCTCNEAGRHFTETTDPGALKDLETLGWIKIDRPIHDATGIPYDAKYWTVTITEEGMDIIDARDFIETFGVDAQRH